MLRAGHAIVSVLTIAEAQEICEIRSALEVKAIIPIYQNISRYIVY